MKKLVVTLLLSSSVMAYSQSSLAMFDYKTSKPIASNEVLSFSTVANDKHTFQIDVKNIGTTTHTYSAKRYDLMLNEVAIGDIALAYFCFAGTCYDQETFVSSAHLVLAPGEKASEKTELFNMLDADLREATKVGFSWVKYTFFNVNVPNDTIQVTLRYNNEFSNGVGIKETGNKMSKIDIFPNPANDFANVIVSASSLHTAKLSVVSSIGELVYEKDITMLEGRNSVHINTQNLAAGVYFVQIKEGHSTTTKKLVIN